MLVATDPTKKRRAPAPPAQSPAPVVDRRPVAHRHRSRATRRSTSTTCSTSSTTQTRAGEPAGAVRVRHAGRRVGHGDHGGSSPQASVKGTRVTVAGPFAPGHTFVQVGDVAAGRRRHRSTIAQTLPAQSRAARGHRQEARRHDADVAAAERAAARCRPTARSSSPATGGAVAAGQPIQLTRRRPAASQRRRRDGSRWRSRPWSSSPASGSRRGRPATPPRRRPSASG